MKRFIIEKDFIVDGFRCVIVGTRLGHRCGYIEIPQGHYLYEKDYNEIHIDIHGGWTYSSHGDDYPVKSNNKSWWIGFDCAHCEDGQDLDLIKKCGDDTFLNHFIEMQLIFLSSGEIRTVEYVENELRNAVKCIRVY